MAVAPGTRLGPYEVLAPLGAGGMGEVYRARDTRLGRDVAVKVLPQHLSAHPEVRARFEREAKTVSSLNHPHICVLHDVGREADTDYLVMELVEGATLAERLAQGPLPASELLKLGVQIADALDKAHRAGVVHRDLKPGNVMLTKSGAKLMDFGLARATGMAGPGAASGVTLAALTQSPTIAQPLTAEGTIVGTFQYMAPEQLEGREADGRSDLWALGCVLYEMATGKRAFEGKSQASLISSIMSSEPAAISTLAPMSPPALERALKQCLAKDPDERWQSAGDLRRELEWIAGSGSQAGVPAPVPVRRRSRERLAWVVAAIGVLAAAGLFAMGRSRPQAAPQPAYLSLAAPDGAAPISETADIAISPDGRQVAFVATDSAGVVRVWVRPLASPAARSLPGTENAALPFWSPDSRDIAFFTPGKLQRIPASGGVPRTVCPAPSGRGGAWSPRGIVVFAPFSEGPLHRVPATGGVSAAVTALDTTRGETGHRFPCFLPDGRHFIYVSIPAREGLHDTRLASLDGGTPRTVAQAGGSAVYAAPGYLLMPREHALVAQRFDAARLRSVGELHQIADIGSAWSGYAGGPGATASRNGIAVYLPDVQSLTRFVWFDRDGRPLGELPLPPGQRANVSISPDGSRIAYQESGRENVSNIWEFDLARAIPTRLTFGEGIDLSPVWSPDGRVIAFSSGGRGKWNLYRIAAGGASREELLLQPPSVFNYPLDWSRDGSVLLFRVLDRTTGEDVWTLPLSGDGKPTPYLDSPFNEMDARISPDGRWVAYRSNESGAFELYVQSFPGRQEKHRVSTGGASRFPGQGYFGNGPPSWSRDGREIRYIGGDGRTVMSVPVTTSPGFSAGPPRPLFKLPAGTLGGCASVDGRRFLALVPASEAQSSTLAIVLDWPGLIPR